MATATRQRPSSILRIPPVRDYVAPGWFERLPRGVGTGGVLLLLLALSGFIRGHYLSGQFWWSEANTVGIASRPLTSIPGTLSHGGGAPFYYLLLHVWIEVFGNGEPAAHALSLLFGLLTIPVAMWFGWTLFDRRVAYLAAALFAFNSYLTQYAEEARPYELMTLLGLVATGSFLGLFVRRRRMFLPLLSLALALLVYTDDWGFCFWLAAAVALVPVLVTTDDRRGVLRDALIAFGLAAIVYVPWLPTLVHQASHATAPWTWAPLLGANEPRQLLGSDRVDAALALAVVVGCGPMLLRARRRTPEAVSAAVCALLAASALIVSLIASIFIPAWVARYFGAVAPALLLLCALAGARSGILGLVMVLVTCGFLANAASFIPTHKSDMRDVAGELAPDLRADDVVLVAEPEQAPLASYYLPGGLRYATIFGPDAHPSYINWDGAGSRLAQADPRTVVRQLVGTLTRGQRILLIRPLTEGEREWSQPYSQLVRRRAAQLGAALAGDPQLQPVPGGFAPHFYRSACCTASSALLYVKR